MSHLIGAIDALGVDGLEDFEFLYREDLMEAGATKAEAEAILEGPQLKEDRTLRLLLGQAIIGPSRPAAQGFQGPPVAARIVTANDRADWARGAPRVIRGQDVFPGSGSAQGSSGVPASCPGSGSAQG